MREKEVMMFDYLKIIFSMKRTFRGLANEIEVAGGNLIR